MDAIEKAMLCENSSSTLAKLLVGFAYIDGDFHPTEFEVIETACREHGIDIELVNKFKSEISLGSTDCLQYCKEAMLEIQDESLKEHALLLLTEIAAADEIFHQKEQDFLSLASETWQLEVKKPPEFVWDKRQIAVINSAPEARIDVHAGPGMGKTAIACARVSYLIDQDVSPSNIWLLSFTRTAVQEIRDRIEAFASDTNSILGVKIGTIDSRAWRIRCGFTETEVKNFFGTYDANINDVIEILENGSRDVREFIDSLEHVIVDEAQDITGSRARLIHLLLRLLPESCGITVFSDPAQAIYQFTTDAEDLREEDRVTFLDLLEKKMHEDFRQHELVKIFRTEKKNLIELIEELRLDIYANENISFNEFKARRTMICDYADEQIENFKASNLKKYNDALFLFRRRAEALMASSFACSDQIPHRIRMSGGPTTVYPWIAQIIENLNGKQAFDKAEFSKLWTLLEHNISDLDQDQESAWNLLYKLGGEKGVVNLLTLRRKLSRTPPDITACLPELGHKGPIVGTIHASKGREADQVVLSLPRLLSREYRRDNEYSNLDEESRVLFVGASRARSALLVGNGFVRASFSPSLKSGRAFLKTESSAKGLPCAQVEIGRDGDIDPYSFVSHSNYSEEEVVKNQRLIANLAQQAPVSLVAKVDWNKNFSYQIWTNFDDKHPSRPIGFFSQALNKDLFQVINRLHGDSSQFRPPDYIHHIYLLGASTFVASEDDPHLSQIHARYASTGTWLVPVVIGFSRVVFLKRKFKKH